MQKVTKRRYHHRITGYETDIVNSAPLQPARLCFDNEGTPVSLDFNDIYFCRNNGLAETRYVFLDGNQLPERFIRQDRSLFVVAESGFGTGLNFLALWQEFSQFRTRFPDACLQRLHMISFEKYPLTPDDLRKAHQYWPCLTPLAKQLQQHWPVALPGCHRLLFEQGQVTLDLWLGDINQFLSDPDTSLHQQVDAWFLDGFAPDKNPGMWSETLFRAMARLTRPGGSVATFSAAGIVRRGLQQAGFKTEKRKGFAAKREMLTARLATQTILPHPRPWYQRLPATSTQEMAIIGGGIASALLALALLRRGIKVTLYCADNTPAQGASGNRQGTVYPLLHHQDQELNQFFLAAFTFARQLYDSLPVNVEHSWCGVTQLAFDEKNQRKLQQIMTLNLPDALVHAVSARQASAACGLPVSHPGLEYPAGGWINPAQLTTALLALAEQQGLTIHYQYNAVALHYQQGWQIDFANGHQRQHRVVILANGWQISQFAQTATLPVTPVAGQVSHIPTTPDLMRLRQVLSYDGYLTPYNPANLTHCLGATHHRYQQHACYRQQDQLLNRQRLIDCLAGQNWTSQTDISGQQARCAVRLVVRDHLPLIGNAPDRQATLSQYARLATLASVPVAPYYQDLFILAALGSRGLTSAPLAAEILAAQISGEPQPLDNATLNALNPNRLWVRKLLKGRIPRYRQL